MKGYAGIAATTLLMIMIQSNLTEAKDTQMPLIVECGQTMTINAQKTLLSTLIKEIAAKCRITISGLEAREKEVITFASSGDKEDVFRRLFKHLNEKNVAFEYSRVGINRISVFPEGKGGSAVSAYVPTPAEIHSPPPPDMSSPQPEPHTVNPSEAPPSMPVAPEPQPVASSEIPPQPQPAEEPPPAEPAVQIVNVSEGSQGQAAGLLPGDIVVEYDGVKISDIQQLVEEVRNRADRGNIQMTVLRNNQPVNVSVQGGTIGIHINNTMIPKGNP